MHISAGVILAQNISRKIISFSQKWQEPINFSEKS